MEATFNKVTDCDLECFPPFHSIIDKDGDLENLDFIPGKRAETRDMQKVLPSFDGDIEYLSHATSTLGIEDNTNMCVSAMEMDLDPSASRSYDFGPITNCLTTMNQVDFIPGEDTSGQELFSAAMPRETIEDDSSVPFHISTEEFENNMIPQVAPSINVHRVTPVHGIESLSVRDHEIITSKQEIKPLSLTNQEKRDPFGPPSDLVANDIVCEKDGCGNNNPVNKRPVKKTRKNRAENKPPTNKRLGKKTRKTRSKNNAVVNKRLVKKIRKTRGKTKSPAEKMEETRNKMKDRDGPPIRALHPNDILCEPGSCGNLHPANIRLLNKVREALPDLANATRKKKTAMFNRFTSSVISSGGRFLVRLNKDAPWMEAKTAVGRKKISHMARDQASKKKKKVAAMEVAV
eukprot:CAMPEP_0113606174 /NCGR_PEP_ID=MMETSP0017_2-20120614/2715_1 /TAXON_ID=2856 /ORGANISM="Cylindrotheca closterium" /LENGTH=403 /DNA_ID=CAMNT_0000514703 /DNA_START=192 /DNA_END=1403 /DNA_ORIENTATION=- /assembly_acc=CAM_ASM_000147